MRIVAITMLQYSCILYKWMGDPPLSGKLNFWEAVLRIMIFLVNSDVFFATWTAGTIFLVDFDLFLVDTSSIPPVRQRCREGRVSRFVTFPSDARRWGEAGFSFYSNTGGLGGIFVPVRRWEDAERDRDSGVKIQIAWIRGALSRMPFEPLSNSKGRQEETLASGGEEGGRVKTDELPATRFYLSTRPIDRQTGDGN